MTVVTSRDWDADAYARFRGPRLRPALDLLAQVPRLPDGPVIDLGCGGGAAGPALRTRYPDRRLIGVDSSPAMLSQARESGAYDRLIEADAGRWLPPETPALIFSNAVLQWLPDHPRLFAWIAGQLGPGGVLAVQMPANSNAPSHRLLREIAARMFPDRFDSQGYVDRVGPVSSYLPVLERFGPVEAWETTYHMHLPRSPEGAHPVRAFTQSTAMRPFLDRLSPVETERYVATYEGELAAHYAAAADGSVRFPFTRLFLMLTRA